MARGIVIVSKNYRNCKDYLVDFEQKIGYSAGACSIVRKRENARDRGIS
jgi:hypothetical protein